MEDKKLTLEDFAVVIQSDIAQMVTKGEFKKALEGFATKEDLKRELERFVTKEDLKEELKRFATKEDLQMALEDVATRNDVRSIVSEGIGEVLKELDKFKYAKEIDALNTRVTRVERKIGIES